MKLRSFPFRRLTGVLALCFAGLALAQPPNGAPAGGFPGKSTLGGVVAPLRPALAVIAWIAVTFCVLRGLPVVVHSLRHYWRPLPVRTIPG